MRFFRRRYVPEDPPEAQEDFRSRLKASDTLLRCPHGHRMDQIMTHKAGWLRCDICGQPQGLGRRMHACWDCDYHVCGHCEVKFQDADWYGTWFSYWHPEGDVGIFEEAEPSASSEDASLKGRPSCPAGHDMVEYFSALKPRLMCDICGEQQRPFVRMFGCHDCNYDVGLCCAPKFEDEVWVSSWRVFWGRPAQPMKGEAAEDAVRAGPSIPEPQAAEPPSAAGDAAGTAQVPVKEAITKPKPQPLSTAQQEVQMAHQENTKSMPLGGKNADIAPGTLLHGQAALQQKPEARKPIAEASQSNPDAAKFIEKRSPKKLTRVEDGKARTTTTGTAAANPQEASEPKDSSEGLAVAKEKSHKEHGHKRRTRRIREGGAAEGEEPEPGKEKLPKEEKERNRPRRRDKGEAGEEALDPKGSEDIV